MVREKRRRPERRRPLIEDLEARLLFSADAAALVAPVEVVVAPDAAAAEAVHVEYESARPASPAITESALRREIVFVDSAVENYEALLEDLRGQTSGNRQLEVVLLESDRSGIDQISEALSARRHDVDSIHVVSHGSDGAVQLGDTWLTNANVATYAEAIAGWGSALGAEADMLFYGCDLASGGEGLSLVDSLSALTGADVAASVDATGATLLGGDWDLEHRTGSVEAAVVFSQAAQQGWAGLLNSAPAGGEIPVNATTAGTQSEVDLAADSSGNFVVVWEDGSGDIIGRRFAADGTPQAPEFTVNATTPGTQASPSVARNASGAFVVAWESDGEIVAQRFAADGSAQGGEIPVNTTTGDVQSAPSVGIDAAGNFVVVWQSANQDGGGNGIYGQRFDSLGATIAGEFPVNTTFLDNQQAATVDMNGTGEFVVVWQSFNGSNWEVQGQLYDASGGTIGSEFTASPAAAVNHFRATVGIDDSSNFVVAWSSGGEVHTRHYDSSAVATGPAATANTTLGVNSSWPAIAMAGDGSYALAWETSGADGGAGKGVFAQEFDSSGSPLGLERIVNSTISGDQRFPAVTGDGSGNFVVAWNGEGPGDVTGIFAQRYRAVGAGTLWLTTQGNVSGGGQDGEDSWQLGDLVRMSDPNLTFENTSPVQDTSGTFSVAFDIDRFAAGAATTAVHYVSSDIQVGSSNFQLLSGDLLIALATGGTLTSGSTPSAPFVNNLTVTNEDVFVFRPDSAGNYGSGTFAMLLETPVGKVLSGVSLVEQDIMLGDKLLEKGDFLLVRGDATFSDKVVLWETIDVGATTTSGTENTLLDGGDANVAISSAIEGIELVEVATTLGGRPLAAGTLLLSVDAPDSVGMTPLPVTEYDIFALSVTKTTLIAGAGNGEVTATLFLDGGDVAFDGGAEILDGFTLTQGVVNGAPVLGANALTIDEGGTVVLGAANVSATDVDDADAGLTFTVSSVVGGHFERLSAVGTPIFSFLQSEVTGSQIQFVHDGWEAAPSYDLSVSDGALSDGPSAATITFTGVNNELWISVKANPLIQEFDPVTLEPVTGVTSGAVSAGFDIMNFTATATEVWGSHYVTQSVTIGTGITFTVEQGDLILASQKGVSLDGTGGFDITTTKDDVFVFRPDVAGNYSAGRFYMLFDGLGGGNEVEGLSLVEQDITVGGQFLEKGSFLYTLNAGGGNRQIHHVTVTDAGTTTTLGTPTLFLDGTSGGVGFDDAIYGVHLVGTNTTLGDTGLTAGQILVSSKKDDGSVGNNGLAVLKSDVFILDVTSPTLADATLLFQGTEPGVGIAEEVRSIAVTSSAPPPNTNPVLGNNSLTVSESGAVILAATDLSATDVETAAPMLTFSVSAVTGGQFERLSGPGVPIASFLQSEVTGGQIRFVHDGGEAAPSYDMTVSDGAAIDGPTASAIAFSNVNDAPTLGNASLAAVNEDATNPPGATISALFGAGFGDVDAGSSFAGIAIVGNTAPGSDGIWQYSSDTGTTWANVGTVGDDTTALAVQASSLLRFLPAADYNGTPTDLTLRGLDNSYAGAWSTSPGPEMRVAVDTTTPGGSTPITVATSTLDTSVTAVNDAPTLGDASLAAVNEDATNPPGATISALFGAGFGDIDAGASFAGIAIVGNTAPGTEGLWQYSSDAGTTWANVGTVGDDATALAVQSTSLLRFLPAADYNGTPTDLTLRGLDNSYAGAWSTTPGPETRVTVNTSTPGGTTPIAAATSALDTSVTAENDAPTLGDASLAAVNEDASNPPGATISSLFGAGFGDVDAGSSFAGIAIVGNTAPGTEGVWQYSSDTGTTWANVGTVGDDATALAVQSTSLLRFLPAADYNGTPTDLTLRGLDNSYAGAWSTSPGPEARVTVDTTTPGGTTPIAAATSALDTSVTAVNDAPTLGDASLAAVNEDATNPPGATISALFGAGFGDVDAGASFAGIAIVGNTAPGTEGVWQYSSDTGTTWANVGTAGDDATALAVQSTSLLRFLPAADYNGTPTDLTLRALDDSYAGAWSTTPGPETRVTVNTSTPGDTTPIAAATSALDTSVTPQNDAPTIANTAAGQTTTDKTAMNPFQSVTIADVDGDPLTVDVRIDDPAKGSLSGAGFTALGGGVYRFSGSAGAATTAIRALSFDPAENRVAVGAVETSTFSIEASDAIAPLVSDSVTSVDSTSINDAPTAATVMLSVAENSPAGTVVGSAAGSDVDPGDPLSYVITAGNTGGAFLIDPATGEIRVADPTALDFEANPVFSLTVQVSDAALASDSGTATVNLGDVSETPVVVSTPAPDPPPVDDPPPADDPVEPLEKKAVPTAIPPGADPGPLAFVGVPPAVGVAAEESRRSAPDPIRGRPGGNARLPLAVDPTATTREAVFFVDDAMLRALDLMGIEMASTDDDVANEQMRIAIGAMQGSAAAVTAGFLSWFLRGGSLLTSLLSSLPMWSRFDPLPVLDAPLGAGGDDDDDDELETRRILDGSDGDQPPA